MHALLAHLRTTAGNVVPTPLAITTAYEEVSFLPGDAGADCWPYQATEQGLRSAARLLRRLHDARTSWVPPADAVWGVAPTEPPEVVCHGDPGPWNMTWIDGQAAGLFDWDFCHPGPRLEDVAYSLEYLAPFRDDDTAMRWLGFTSPPDRSRRLRVFCEECGIESTGVVDAVIDLQRLVIGRVRSLADAGIQPQDEWVAEGYLDELAGRIAWSEAHRNLFD